MRRKKERKVERKKAREREREREEREKRESICVTDFVILVIELQSM